MKKILLITMVLIVSFSGVFTLVIRRVNEPYRVVEQFIEEAKQNIDQSKYIIDKDTWEELKGESIYRVVRKEIDWGNFKNIVQKYENNQMAVGPKDKLYYRYKKFEKEYADLYVYIYDNLGEEVYSKRLFMHKIDSEWKIVGEDKNY